VSAFNSATTSTTTSWGSHSKAGRTKKVIQTVTDPETGERKRVEVTKQHRLWWRRGENGFVVFPRIGFKRVELVEGNPAIAANSVLSSSQPTEIG